MNPPITILPLEQVRAELSELGLFPDSQWPDAFYVVPDHDWYERDYLPYYVDSMRAVGVPINGPGYIPEQADCEDFGDAHRMFMKFCLWRAGLRNAHGGLLAGNIRVTQANAFGRVPGGGGRHALSLTRTTRGGWWVTEPQTVTYVPFADYPNRTSVVPGWPRF